MAIEPDRYNMDYLYQNTRNYDAGIATANLIREATFIAWQRLGLTYEEAKKLDLPF